MKLAIIGGRDFNDYELMENTIFTHFHYRNNLNLTSVISGGAQGADSLARRFAEFYELKLVEYLPDWNKHGKSAGFVRNKLIISDCDFLLAMWDGESKGTGHSLSIAKKLKKPTLIIYY